MVLISYARLSSSDIQKSVIFISKNTCIYEPFLKFDYYSELFLCKTLKNLRFWIYSFLSVT